MISSNDVFLNVIHNHISVCIHIYLIILHFITEYSARYILPFGEHYNSLTAVPERLS